MSGNRKKPWLARRAGVTIGTYATRAEAQKALERLTDERITHLYNLTFSECYSRWLSEHEREVGETARGNYKTAYNQCEALHGRKIGSIRRSEYQECIIDLEQQGKSKSTCEKLRGLFTMICRWAVDEGVMTKSPAEGLTIAAGQLSENQIFPQADIDAIKASQLPAADIALILISCGCRPGELFSVPLADCTPDYFIGGSKTAAGRGRVIPIGPDGLQAYRRMMASSPGPLLVDGYQGNRKYSNFAKREWRDLMQEIGREGYTPYSCRHTFVTRAIRSGMDLPRLEAIVGHVDRKTTRIYTHLQADDLVQAVCSGSVASQK